MFWGLFPGYFPTGFRLVSDSFWTMLTDVSYVGFDLGRTPYSKKAEKFLTTLFPGKFQVHFKLD